MKTAAANEAANGSGREINLVPGGWIQSTRRHDSMHDHRPRMLRSAQRLTTSTAVAGLIVLAVAGAARADSLTTQISFGGGNGAEPYAALLDANNRLYGTAFYGGTSGAGTLFSYDPSSGSLTGLASFDGRDGANPDAGLLDVNNTLYGTTLNGGISGSGTLFAYDPSNGSLRTLVSFMGSNGASPHAGLIDVNNTLYGTTTFGGATAVGGTSGFGTIFSYNLASGSLTTLVSFNGRNGDAPFAGLLDVGNILYGTTTDGGRGGEGTLFSYDLSNGSLKTLVNFSGSNGGWPYASLLHLNNSLYGTTDIGGSSGNGAIFSGFGTLFSYDLSNGSLTTLYNFHGASSGNGALVGVNNTLYGTIPAGGSGGYDNRDGTLFSYDLSNGSLTTLVSFNGSIGNGPFAGLLDVSNTLYGTTSFGGNSNVGTIFTYQLPTSPTGVPEPGSLALFATGAAALGLVMIRRRRGER